MSSLELRTNNKGIHCFVKNTFVKRIRETNFDMIGR